MKLSIVIPVYKSIETIEKLFQQIREKVSSNELLEVIFVDDGCPLNSWGEIERLSLSNPLIKGIKLSRNFGQHPAITAGLEAARGEWVVVMDCDLQDDPIYINQMFHEAIAKNVKIVYSKKASRKHGFFKNIFSKLFFKVFNFLTASKDADDKTGNFSLIHRDVVNAFLAFGDYHRHYLMILRNLGFSSSSVSVEHRVRESGRSSYSPWALIKHAENGIVSQSNRLLYMSIIVGFGFVFVSAIIFVRIIVFYFLHNSLAGYTSLMGVLLLSTGTITISLGIHGMYISKIFDQVRNRPLYIIERRTNHEK